MTFSIKDGMCLCPSPRPQADDPAVCAWCARSIVAQLPAQKDVPSGSGEACALAITVIDSDGCRTERPCGNKQPCPTHEELSSVLRSTAKARPTEADIEYFRERAMSWPKSETRGGSLVISTSTFLAFVEEAISLIRRALSPVKSGDSDLEALRVACWALFQAMHPGPEGVRMAVTPGYKHRGADVIGLLPNLAGGFTFEDLRTRILALRDVCRQQGMQPW